MRRFAFENDFIEVVMNRSVVGFLFESVFLSWENFLYHDSLSSSKCEVASDFRGSSSSLIFGFFWQFFDVALVRVVWWEKIIEDLHFVNWKIHATRQFVLFFCFRRGAVWFEHSIVAVRRCWSTPIEEKFQWNLMVSPLFFYTQRYLSLSLRKSIQLAIRRSATITVDLLISAPNSSDNHKTQEKIHWTICSITNYTKVFPEKYLHRNRFFSAKNSLHSSKREHAQTQEQILNLLQREFCLSNDTTLCITSSKL